MMKSSHTILCIAIFPVIVGLSLADKCPPSPPLTKEINYDLITGNWILAASKPEFDEKCKNLTFIDDGHGNIELHEELFMSNENWKHETNVYKITKAENSPIMFLENKSTHDKVKLFLVDGDYTSYIIFYSCDDGTGYASEAWEIWTRGIKYESINLPKSIVATLNKLNFKPGDFAYTTTADCTH